MGNKNIAEFVATYGPVAQQVSKEINVDPNVLLSQWGLESRWGQSEMAKKYHNLGGIKDFSGKGFEAKDNKTGSMDKYVKFEDPEIFGMYYVDQIRRNFPLAANTGPDVGAFTRGLASGKRGSYFGVPVQEYESSLTSAQSSIPEDKLLPFVVGEPPAQPAAEPVSEPQETDEQRDARIQGSIDEQEKRQAQLMGGAAGAGIAATKAAGSGAGAVLQAGANRVGQGFRAGMQGNVPQPPQAPPAAPAAPGKPPLGSTIMRQPTAGPLSNLMPNEAQSTRILQGTTDASETTGRARMGFNETTAQQAAARKDIAPAISKLQQMGLVSQDAPTFFARQPGMTSTPSGVQYPASPAPVTLGARGPEGQIGYNRPPSPPPVAPPSAPSFSARVSSGLDSVNNLFRGMMQPIAQVSRYIAPPLSLASAAGEGVNIKQQLDRPANQRDMTSMGLSGLNILGSGMSLFPATAPVGIPLMLGTGAAQLYRDNPEAQQYIKRKMEGLANTPLLDEMTGLIP